MENTKLERFSMRIFLVLLLPLVLTAQTQVNLSQQAKGTLRTSALPGGVKQIPTVTVNTLPASPAQNDMVIATDCESESACTTGGGTNSKLLLWNGSQWDVVGDGGAGGSVNLERLDIPVAAAGTIDFSRDFTVAEGPTGEVNVSLNHKSLRHAHRYASSGSGTSSSPWIYSSGVPWAEAIADGATAVLFVPGYYQIDNCPAIIPSNVSILGFNRQSTWLVANCRGLKSNTTVTNATNATPIQITTSAAHGYSTGDWARVEGVLGNPAANGKWQVTTVDATHFTLNGSAGSGSYVSTAVNPRTGKLFSIASITDASPVTVITNGAHGLTTGDRVLVSDVTGTSSPWVNGLWTVTVVDADTVALDGCTKLVTPASGGFLQPLAGVNAISTADDVRGIEFSGFTITVAANSLIANLVRYRGSESVIEEIQGSQIPAESLDHKAAYVPGGQSASIRITDNVPVGSTFTLTQTGGGSRATGPYNTVTVATAPPTSVNWIASTAGGFVEVAMTSTAYSSGNIVQISSMPETDAIGASGLFPILKVGGDRFQIIGLTGNGNSCSSGCGGATVTLTAISPVQAATQIIDSLKSQYSFTRDYSASLIGNGVHLVERRLAAKPSTMSVVSDFPHTVTNWAQTDRGGNFFLMVDANSFSSRFGRIFCPGTYLNFHCIGMRGTNNQHSIRDTRLSGALAAGWAIRLLPGVPIQNIDIFNITTESSYGAAEISTAIGSSIRTIYMEGPNEFGIIADDTYGSGAGFTFLQGLSIANGLLLGNDSLILGKGKAITVESVVAHGSCVIGRVCEDCVVTASYLKSCDIQSASGYVESSTPVGKPVQPIDRYGQRLATGAGALLAEPVTNYALWSEDWKHSPWFNSGVLTRTDADGPFGETMTLNRYTIANPVGFQQILIGNQYVSGLTPNTVYGLSYWMRVRTQGASCRMTGGGDAVYLAVTVAESDGWQRVAGTIQTDSSGTLLVTARCTLQQGGLAEFTADAVGLMVYDRVRNAALPPYVKTEGAPASTNRGIYLQAGTINAPNSTATVAPGGTAVACEKYTVTHNEVNAAATTEDVTLFSLPARGKLTGVNVKHSQAFSGGGITGMTVSVGDSSSPTFYTSAFSVSQAVSDTAMQDTLLFKSSTAAARDVRARFTATGGNVSAATAGSADISACWVVLP